jgi:dihydroorotase
MTNRRQLIGAAVGAVLYAHLPRVRAQGYDLIVRGGRVIDPSSGVDAVCDVGVAGGRIVAVEPSLGGGAAELLDAAGKIVVPGLIDIHTHAGRDAEAPAAALHDGVTGLLDAGSGGADTIDAVVGVLRNAPQICRVLLSINRGGIVPGRVPGFDDADVELARGAIARHPGIVAGIKVRVSANVVGDRDLEILRRAQAAATPFDLPVMVHIGQSHSPLRALLPLLKPGDLVTHMYAPAPNGILDERGKLVPDVLAARRRGVLFDFGHGVTGHFDWDTIARATEQGLWPDTISTDWNIESQHSIVVDFPNVLSKLLLVGMPLREVIAAATVAPARAFPAFEDRGTLNIGAPADIAVLELRDGRFEFVDNYGNERIGQQRLFPFATVLGGSRVANT